MTTQQASYSFTAKLIHLGLAGFGIAAFLTGELAEGGSASGGYLLHAYLGLSLAAVMAMRFLTGFGSSESPGFRHWGIFSKGGLRQLMADIRSLLRWRVPEGERHQGLSGLVQAFGLLLFGWMAFSGVGLYFLDGAANHDLFEMIEEAHEVGEGLIPVYLLLHVGAVILHTLVGQPVWQRMFRFGR